MSERVRVGRRAPKQVVEQLTRKIRSKLWNVRDKMSENVLTTVRDEYTRHIVRRRTQQSVDNTVRWEVRWSVWQVAQREVRR